MNIIQPISEIASLHICLGTACNHRCIMCYQKDFSTKMNEIVYKERLLPVYPYLQDLTLQGGEPTILKEVREMADLVLSINNNVKLSMVTNGHKFNEYWQNIFKERGNWLHVSFNAATEETYKAINLGGNWTELITNFSSMRKINPIMPMYMTMCVLDENIHEISKLISLAHDLGATACRYFFDFNKFPRDKRLVISECEKAKELSGLYEIPGHGLDNLINFSSDVYGGSEGLKDFSKLCPNPFNHLYIEASGELKFCCYLEHFVGNLNENTLEEIWNNGEVQIMRQRFFDKKYAEAGCDMNRCQFF
jgi:GTP 3',8-cyclase